MNINLSKKCGIYKIENVVNGKLYVGSSVNLHVRRSKHYSKLKNNKHDNEHLQNAFNKYSIDNIIFKVIEIIGDTEFGKANMDYVLEREQYWIDLTGCTDRKFGYNICKIAGSTVGVVPSDDTRKKLSEANKGKACPEHVKKKLSEDRKGKPISDNTQKAKLEATRKPVINIETGEKYKSLKQATQLTNFSQGTIIRSCKGIGGWQCGCNFAYLKKDGTFDMPNREAKELGRNLINLDTGEVFKKISLACEKYKLSKSSINKCCNGKASQAGGFRWAYLDDNEKPIIKTFEITKGRKVINLTTGVKFQTCAEASRFYNVQKSKISECCIGKRKTCGGFSWSYLDDNGNVADYKFLRNIVRNKKSKPKAKKASIIRKIKNIESGIVYQSVAEAGRAYNAKSTTRISDCCHGRAKTAFGCHWQFFE